MKHIKLSNRLSGLFLAFSILVITNGYAQQNRTSGLSPEVIAWTVSTLEPWPPDKYKSLKEAMIDNNFYIHYVFRGGLITETPSPFILDSIRLMHLDFRILPSDYLKTQRFPIFKQFEIRKTLDDLVYKEVLLKNPRKFKYSTYRFPDQSLAPTSTILQPNQIARIDVEKPAPIPEKVDHVIKFIPDRKYWTSSFAADIKFSQNRSTANWYKGEINNMNIYTNTITSYNYAKDKISVSNTLSTKFTINNAPNDTLRKYTIGDDELRFRSNFGLKAIRNWNYSSSAEFITSLGNKYVTNSQVKNSAFLSPFTINAGIGMTYAVKPAFKKKDRALNLALSIEPLAFKYMYSKDKNINLSAYFDKDESGTYYHSLRTFGSTITMTQTTKFGRNAWYTRFYYFTNYERIIGELENKLDIALNRFFSTTLYLYLRYDDGVTRKKESDSFLQINEMFSFGFSYRW
jgi:hypothetical protein